jgi:transcriptional regulator with XRE-family HTH domain
MKNQPPPTLGERIKELRLARNLSMRQLAAGAGLKSVAFVSDVERGFRHPSIEVLTGLAASLDVPLSELRGLDQRAPVEEIKTLTERDPDWAMAFRSVVDAASTGGMTPEQLVRMMEKRPRRLPPAR